MYTDTSRNMYMNNYMKLYKTYLHKSRYGHRHEPALCADMYTNMHRSMCKNMRIDMDRDTNMYCTWT